MKKIIILSIISFAIVLSSCDDGFLDRKPYDALSNKNIWTSDANATMAINGIYSALNGSKSGSGQIKHCPESVFTLRASFARREHPRPVVP